MPAQLQQWIDDASKWVADNSTDVIYIAAVVAAFAILGSGGSSRR